MSETAEYGGFLLRFLPDRVLVCYPDGQQLATFESASSARAYVRALRRLQREMATGVGA